MVSWAPSPDTVAAARAVGLVAAACVVCYLAATSDRRQLSRSVGYGLLAVAALGPVVYPWYLLWGLICLAPTAASRFERRLVVTASGFACFMGLTGLNHTGVVVSEVLLFAFGIVVAAWWWGPALLRTTLRRRVADAPDRSVAQTSGSSSALDTGHLPTDLILIEVGRVPDVPRVHNQADAPSDHGKDRPEESAGVGYRPDHDDERVHQDIHQ
jgi:hypothetical protein